MAVDDDNLSDETLLEVCRLSADHEELTPELLQDLKAVRLLVGPRRTADGRLEHAVALLVSALGSFTLHNPRHLPFGYSGPTIRSKDWVAKETVERTLIQIAGLIWTDTAPAVATIVQRAVSQAVALGLAEQSHYDTWEPGMVSGSGWRDVLSATPYGVTKARKLADALRASVTTASQPTQTRSELCPPSGPTPTRPPAMDEHARTARRQQLDAEHRSFREQVRRELDEIVLAAASARTKGDVPAILNQLIGEISLWTRQLKHETFVVFDDTEEARLNRRMMKHEPGGISLLPAYITLGFSVAPDALDLVELAVGSSQADSLARRLQELDDVRHEFAVAVATLASTWDADSEKDYNAFAQLDEHRSSTKLSAFEVCRYIETLAHLVASRSGTSQATADTNGNSGKSKTKADQPPSSPAAAPFAPADSAGTEANINGLLDDANYCLTILGDLRRDFQSMHSASRRMEGGGEEWHFANSSDEAHYNDASQRSRAQVADLVEPLGRVLTWGCQRNMEIHDRADLLKVDGSSWQNADQCHAYELDVRAVLNVLLIERTKSARRKDSQPESSPRRDPVTVWLAAETLKSIATGLSLHAILTRMNKPSDYDDRDKMSRDFKLAQKHGYLLVSVARQLSLDPQPLTRMLREDRLWEYPAEKDDVAVFRAVTELAERIITEARVWCAEAGIDPEAAIKERLVEPPDSMARRSLDGTNASEQSADNTLSAHDVAPVPNDGSLPRMDPAQARTASMGTLMLLAQTYYKLLEDAVSLASWCTSLDLKLNHAYLWTVNNITNLLKNDKALADFPEPFKPLLPDLYPSTIGNLEWQDMIAPQAEGFLSAVQQYVIAKGYVEPEKTSQAWLFIEVLRPGAEDALRAGREYHERMRQHVKQLLEKPKRPHGNGDVQAAPVAATATAKPPSGSPAASSIAHDEIDRATASGLGTDPAPTLKIGRRGDPCFVRGKEKPPLTDAQHELVSALLAAGEAGMKKDQLTAIRSGALMTLRTLREGDSDWATIIQMAGKTNGRYRIRQ